MTESLTPAHGAPLSATYTHPGKGAVHGSPGRLQVNILMSIISQDLWENLHMAL